MKQPRPDSTRGSVGLCPFIRQFERLESRTLLAITIEIRYDFDSQGFFNDVNRRNVLQAAANDLASRLTDTLSPIIPSSGNTWEATFTHPGSGQQQVIPNLTVPAD